MRIVLIVGARPNFIKAYPVYKALKSYQTIEMTLIHTGQHFDVKMSDLIFSQLGLPKPDIHLNLESKSRAGDLDTTLYVNNQEYLMNKPKVLEDLCTGSGMGQIGEIRDKLVIEFGKILPDYVMVFGDITSTLAGAIAGSIVRDTGAKANTRKPKIIHVESGLRSNDLSMPEEVNRILTDFIADYHFITEQSGFDNLCKEDLLSEDKHLFLVGNTMIDSLSMFLPKALETNYHISLGLLRREYVLVTLHRPSNVDDISKLSEIMVDMLKLGEKIVFPIHPRTRKNLQSFPSTDNIILCEPLGYLEFTCLEANAKYVITDSGGIQEETTALNVPCFTLRENTERPSTLIENGGTNTLITKLSSIKNIHPSSSIKCNTHGLNIQSNASHRILEVLDTICAMSGK